MRALDRRCVSHSCITILKLTLKSVVVFQHIMLLPLLLRRISSKTLVFEFSALNYVLPMYSASERESLLFGLAYANVQQFLPILNEVKWTQEVIKSLQDSIFNGPQVYYCTGDNEVSSISYVLVEQFNYLGLFCTQEDNIFGNEGIPSSECPYLAPDSCTGFEPQTCCERLQGSDHGVQAAPLSLFSLFSVLSMAFIMHVE